MIKTELKKMAMSIPTMLFVVFIMVVSCFDVYLNSKPFLQLPFIEQKMLLTSSAQGHFSVILLFWIFPLYVFFISSERLITERITNNYLLEAIRSSRRRTLIAKLTTPAIFFAITYFIVIWINVILTIVFLKPDAIPFNHANAANMLECIPIFKKLGFGVWMFEHRMLTYFIYSLFMTMIVFTMTTFISMLSIAFPSRKIVYPTCLILWLIGWMTPYDFGKCIQPFTEYGLSYAIVGVSLFMICTLIPILILIRKAKRLDYL